MDGVTSNVQTQLNGKAASDHSHIEYLSKSGDTLTGPLIATGGDASTAGKIILNPSGLGQITDNGTSTLFGFTSATTLIVGQSNYNTTIRGKASRPTYNGNDMALQSDIPSITIATDAQIQALFA